MEETRCLKHQTKICNHAGIFLERMSGITKNVPARSQNNMGGGEWAQPASFAIYLISKRWKQKGASSAMLILTFSEGNAFGSFCTCHVQMGSLPLYMALSVFERGKILFAPWPLILLLSGTSIWWLIWSQSLLCSCSGGPK